VVEPWRAEKLIDEDARRNGVARRAAIVEVPAESSGSSDTEASDTEVPDAAGHLRRAGLVELCLKCAPTERCGHCPFEPFVLAA
jgi:hypothetical protein